MKASFHVLLLISMLTFGVSCNQTTEDDPQEVAACLEQYAELYLETYIDARRVGSNNFNDDVGAGQVQSFHQAAANSVSSNCCGTDESTSFNLSSHIEQKQVDTSLTEEERQKYIEIVSGYMASVSPNAFPGTIEIPACQ